MQIADYIDSLIQQLATLNFDNQCKFSAWCCLGILNDDVIKSQFIAMFGLQNYQMCKAIVEAGFYNYQLINIKQSRELVDELTQNDAIFVSDDIAVQGVNEFLIALERLVIGIDKQDCNYLANPAENALNWQDMRDNFIESVQADSNYQNEMAIQKRFLENLQNGISIMSLNTYRTKIKSFYENIDTSDWLD